MNWKVLPAVYQFSSINHSSIIIEVPKLDVLSLPRVLFSGDIQTLLEGSVVWLYCLVIPVIPSRIVTWNRDGELLDQDVPHIRLRSIGSDADMYSTYLLIIEDLVISDSGVYQCNFQDGGNTESGAALNLTGMYKASWPRGGRRPESHGGLKK